MSLESDASIQLWDHLKPFYGWFLKRIIKRPNIRYLALLNFCSGDCNKPIGVNQLTWISAKGFLDNCRMQLLVRSCRANCEFRGGLVDILFNASRPECPTFSFKFTKICSKDAIDNKSTMLRIMAWWTDEKPFDYPVHWCIHHNIGVFEIKSPRPCINCYITCPKPELSWVGHSVFIVRHQIDSRVVLRLQVKVLHFPYRELQLHVSVIEMR